MPETFININNSEVKAFTKKLQTLHRSALPLAVRGTLNDMAYDVYKKTMPAQFKNDFTIRNKTFLSSHSGFEKANGWNIGQMKSRVGITPKGSKAASGLTQQEYGGAQKKPFVYMNRARFGNSSKKLVKPGNYFNSKKLLKGGPSHQRSEKSQFVADAIMAMQTDSLLFIKSKNGKVLASVRSISQSRKSKKISVIADPIASYKDERKILIKPKHFLSNASMLTYKNIEQVYVKNAKNRIEKALR